MPYYDCQHHYVFIASERGQDTRKSAYVCTRCGSFRVWINGEVMNFQLVSDEQVAAAGVYAEELKRSEMQVEP